MKRCLLFSLLMLLVAATAHGQVSFGQPELFNDDWLFSLSDDVEAAKPEYDETGWRKLTLPHDWSIEAEPSRQWASCTGYLPGGVGWYRKHFIVHSPQFSHSERQADYTVHSSVSAPKGGDEARHYIYFEGVYNRSEVYLNGHLLGKRPNGYASFMYDLPPSRRRATMSWPYAWTTAAMPTHVGTQVRAFIATCGLSVHLRPTWPNGARPIG